MSSLSSTAAIKPKAGAQALVETLLRCGIDTGFGIPSIHNIPIYECLRQASQFQHWIVRHEQAAGFAADGFYRRSGKPAVVFASTGPGNLFTLVPLLEALQTNTPVLVIGSNIASPLLAKTGGALHETPHQVEIIRPLTRYARRVNTAEEIPQVVVEAVKAMRGPVPGPAFIEIPHDLFAAPSSELGESGFRLQQGSLPPQQEFSAAEDLLQRSRRPVFLVGGGVHDESDSIQRLAEKLQSPVLTTTSGKGRFPDDHALAMGCIARLGAVQEVFDQADLLISFGARLTEFDTGRFGLRLPAQHIQIVSDPGYPGDRLPATLQLVGDSVQSVANDLGRAVVSRQPWCDLADLRAREKQRLESLNSDAYTALRLLREVLHRDDVVVNDQSILNYWASAFFPVYEPGAFIYPWGSGTLGYGLPAGIGAACAIRKSGGTQKVICIAGDGGFQYTLHELATVAQYNLPVKILVVNDNAYGVIGFLQRSLFGHTHEVDLRNPDFCGLAEAYGIAAQRATSINDLGQKLSQWLNEPGPSLLEWQTQLKAPWEIGAIPRPTGVEPAKEKSG
jgi:5-guanidino-2-oxopentanoate decarboxylase